MTSLWLGALALDSRGEPNQRVHPVVWIGRLISWLERRSPTAPRDQLVHGLVVAALPAISAAAVGAAVGRLRRPWRWLAVMWLLKTTFALRGLLEAGLAVQRRLAAGDLDGAHQELRSLVSRDVTPLDRPHTASAAVESLAENLCDSYVAPLFWYAIGGLPAALAYRAVNTADAMVGYRGRYEYLGKASARLDDALNYLPARITGLALVCAAPLVGLNGAGALRTMRRDRARTASPNAGWPMSATAGALGVWLEKPGHYRLGDGRDPGPLDVAAARHLTLVAAGLCTAVAAVRWNRR